MEDTFPIKLVRSKFPALKRNLIYFDGPGGTQMVDSAIEKMTSYISNGMANLHGAFPTSIETEELIEEARAAVSDLLNCKSTEVAFGANMTTLAFAIARSLGKLIKEGDEIVVTELDHRANVDPWVTLAKDVGAIVKFIPLNSETFTLDVNQLDDIITPKTKLVAVGMSSNVTGTITDVQKIAKKAKEVHAFVIVDAVHAAPHIAIDFASLQVDVLLCSAYKFFGPHIGIAIIKEQLFEQLVTYKLEPAPTEYPHKLETGTQNHEGIAGLIGAIEFIESLGTGETRKDRLHSGIERIDFYEMELAQLIESTLREVPGITLYRSAEGIKKTPTFAFTLQDINSREACEWLGQKHNMCVAHGDFYASTMGKKFGIYDNEGWIRIGLAPYNTVEEVQSFLQAINEYIETSTDQ